ncbi:LSM-domain-containing protein [Suillus decipiens]|nr:LSM-domain-containing protein [Suillus decipiens]
MSSLQGYVDSKSRHSLFIFIITDHNLGRVLLVLQDGRAIVGVLAGYDQKSNVVLSDSKERIYSIEEGVEEVELGLYLVKGDMIVLIGEIDEAIDQAVDLASIRAEPILPIRY